MNDTLHREGVASGRGSSEVTQVVNKRILHTADLIGIATWNVYTNNTYIIRTTNHRGVAFVISKDVITIKQMSNRILPIK